MEAHFHAGHVRTGSTKSQAAQADRSTTPKPCQNARVRVLDRSHGTRSDPIEKVHSRGNSGEADLTARRDEHFGSVVQSRGGSRALKRRRTGFDCEPSSGCESRPIL